MAGNHGHEQCLEQQGEAAVGPCPGHVGLLDAALVAADARHTGVEVGLVLEEVEMAPGSSARCRRPGSRRRRSWDRGSGCPAGSRSGCRAAVPRGRSRCGSPSRAASARVPVAAGWYRASPCLSWPDLSEHGAAHSPPQGRFAPRKRGGPGKGPGPSLTGAVRGAWGSSGRDEETAPFSRTKKRDQVGGVARRGKGQTFQPT